MNAASFNSFIRLLEDISSDVLANDATRKALNDSLSEAVNNLYNHLETGLGYGLQ